MYISCLLLPLTVALTAVAEPLAEPQPLPAGIKYAVQYKRTPTTDNKLAARIDTSDPELYCGANYNDCGDGWCCSSDLQCAGKLYDIPVCKDPTNTQGFLGGTEPATPYKDPEQALSSLQSVLAEITAGNIPTQFGGATNTGSPQNAQSTGGAAVGGPREFGNTVMAIAAVWGVAALGGAGWLLL